MEGSAAARLDGKLRTKLREEQMEHLTWWTEIYRAWQRGQNFDRTVDIEAVMMLLWSAELRPGVLEACGIDPPGSSGLADGRRALGRLSAHPGVCANTGTAQARRDVMPAADRVLL